MKVKLPDRQNQALAILAIATAAIGFGLFGVDFDLQTPTAANPDTVLAFAARLAGILGALVYYSAVLWSAAKLLIREDKITGRELILGPVVAMGGEMASLTLIFLVEVFA